MADLIRRSDVIGLIEDMLLFGEYDIIASSFSKADEEKAYQAINDIPAQNRWIPVEDALPEIKEFHISDTVLCYCDSGALAIARLEENGFGQVGFNCEKDDEYHHSAGKVLYWMQIPEIPEPQKEDEA